ncbi:MAG: hypothetical protein IJ571_09300 [Ruminococcus sp.]|nr:hypothetical protein [Ruminococcus sp.]
MKDKKDKNRKKVSKLTDDEFVGRDTFVNSEEPMPELSARERRRLRKLEEKKRLRDETERKLKEELEQQKKAAVKEAPARVSDDTEAEQKVGEVTPAEAGSEAAENAETAPQGKEKKLTKEEKQAQKAQIKKNRESIVLIKREPEDDDEDDDELEEENDEELGDIEEELTEAHDEEDEPDEEEADEEEPAQRKKKKSKVTDIRSARKKEKMRRHIKTYIALIIIAVFGLVVYFTRDSWVPKLEGILDKPHATIINDGKTAEGNFPISFDETSVNSIEPFSDCFIRVDDHHIIFYDEAGNVLSSQSHTFANPVVQTAGKRVMVYDNGGNSLTVMNKKGELFSKEIDSSILLAQIGNNSNVAVITQNEKYEAVLTVYDADGNEIYKWQSYKKVIDISFDEDGEGCFITTFRAENGLLDSYITYVEFDKEEPVMTSNGVEDLVLEAEMNDNGDYWVIGSEYFYKLDENGNQLFKYEYSGDLIDYSLTKTTASIVVKGVGKGRGTLTIFRSDSDSDNPNSVIYTDSGTPKKLHSSGSMSILLSENSIDAYDKAGNLLATAGVSSDYVDFAFLNDNVYFLDVREINKIGFKT